MAKAFIGYSADASGYPSGGAISTLKATLAFGDTAAKALFTIPAGAVITAWVLNVTTLFNSDGTDQVNIGVSGTAAKYVTALDVSSTGLKSTGVVAVEIGAVQSLAPVLGIYVPGGSAASTGALTIMVQFYIP